MAHDPKLNIYILKLKPGARATYHDYRWLFRNKIGEANTTPLEESFIMGEIFAKFIQQLDTPQMYSDSSSQKCMTANQPDIENDNVNPNLILHSHDFIIEGRVEGGSFGRRRNKTSTQNKIEKSAVMENDAITEDFYFLIYTPFHSSKSVLMIQSFSDDTIDSVVKKFWQTFMSHSPVFNKPEISRFIPQSIIDSIKNNSTISSLSFSTEMPGGTLLDEPIVESQHDYSITIEIKPAGRDLSHAEYEGILDRIKRAVFRSLPLGQFTRRTGTLRDSETQRNSKFELDTEFEIHPTIFLSKHIPDLVGNAGDFDKIKDFCFTLLEDIKTEIYPQHAVRQR